VIKENDTDVAHVESIHDGSGKATIHEFFKGKHDLRVFVHNTILTEGATIGFHEHKDSEEIYYVISGKGLMRVDDEEREVGTGDAVLTKRGSSHGIKNVGNTNLRLVVIGDA